MSSVSAPDPALFVDPRFGPLFNGAGRPGSQTYPAYQTTDPPAIILQAIVLVTLGTFACLLR